jgi:hypothetical protein
MLDKNRLADILVPIMEEGYELISKMIILSKNGLLDYNIKF